MDNLANVAILEGIDEQTRSKLLDLASATLQNKVDVLRGGRSIYVIALELGLKDTRPFEYLWALNDDFSELWLSDSDRDARHRDLLASKDKALADCAEFYKERVYATCRYIESALG